MLSKWFNKKYDGVMGNLKPKKKLVYLRRHRVNYGCDGCYFETETYDCVKRYAKIITGNIECTTATEDYIFVKVKEEPCS